MNLQDILRKGFGAAVSVVFVFSICALAQSTQPKATLVLGPDKKPMPVVSGNNLYCAGYLQSGPVNTSNKIVGAEDEQEQYNYAEGDNLYINVGAEKGAKVGDLFAVIRPRGILASRWSSKGNLGFLVQEVGVVEIVKVRNEVAVARVKTSCNSISLGDLLQPVQQRESPLVSQRPALDVFASPSGKATGSIVLARDGREMLGREDIVYLDLGAEDNVRTGDHLTIFRPLGDGNLFHIDKEAVSARDEGYQSDKYRGGKYSNQAARKQGETAQGAVVTTAEAKSERPSDLRKVVGEMVIIGVRDRTATAVITRAVQEVHTGDRVEVQ